MHVFIITVETFSKMNFSLKTVAMKNQHNMHLMKIIMMKVLLMRTVIKSKRTSLLQ
jgi:hypothetical protein